MKQFTITLLLSFLLAFTLSGQTDYYSFDEKRITSKNDFAPVDPANYAATAGGDVFKNSYWSRVFSVPGIIGRIGASTTDGSNLFLGGSFRIAGDKIAHSVVKWDGKEWSSIGHGPENGVHRMNSESPAYVHALAYSEGKLFVGGQCSKAGTKSINGIAFWENDQWHRLGIDSLTNGVRKRFIIEGDTIIGHGFVYALFVHGNKLYVGGDFHLAGEQEANGVAIWDMETEEWESMKGGLESPIEFDAVYAYSFAVKENEIYVGGKFHSAGGIPAKNIAKWDGTNWHNIGEAEAYVYDLEFDSAGILYASGFNYPDQLKGHCGLAKYDGFQWQAIQGPSNFLAEVSDLHIYNNTFYANGYFYDPSNNYQYGTAKWHGTDWEFLPPLGISSNDFLLGGATTIETVNGKLYFAGEFTKAGEFFPINVAEWKDVDSSWVLLNDGIDHQGIHGGNINAVARFGEHIYAGGFFSVIGGVFARNIAKWNGAYWEALGDDYFNGIRGSLNCILVEGNQVFVGGYFGVAGTVEAYHVAHWDGNQWHSIGIGVGGVPGASVNALAKVGDYLYVGGYFAIVGDEENYAQQANSIARFHLPSKRWEAIGKGVEYYEGVPGVVNALEVFGDKIYVAGIFNFADNTYYRNFAVLTDNKWTGIEMNQEIGIEGNIYIVRVINDEIYIGGLLFPERSPRSVGLMKWVEKEWETVGDSLSNEYGNAFVNSIEPYGDGFLIGGNFAHAGDQRVNNIAYYDGSSWHSVGGGIQPGISDIEVFEDRFYFGGPEEMFIGNIPSVGLAEFNFQATTSDDNEFRNPLSGIEFLSFPNPFEGEIKLLFNLAYPGILSVNILNQNGQLVHAFLPEFRTAGEYQIDWNARHLPDGIYYCHVRLGREEEVKKIVLTKN